MINENYFLLNVFALTLGTIVIRGSFIAFAGKMTISPKVRELFSFIPAAILPGLIIPATFYNQGQIDWLLHKERFFIILITLIFSYFIRNTFAIIAFGMGLLLLLTKISM